MVNKTVKKKRAPVESVYSKADYDSNDGMLTSVWGPSMWHYLHSMSFNYPTNPTPSNKKHYLQFILSLQFVLPCGKCRANLVENFKKLPLQMKDMKNRETFSRYVYNLHELINTMLGKCSNLTYDDVRDRYEHFRSRCVKTAKKRVKIIDEPDLAKTELGCTRPLYGEKSKCILKIVPDTTECESLTIDKKCIKTAYTD